MGDPIQALPTNSVPPTKEEREIIGWMFPPTARKEAFVETATPPPSPPEIRFRFELKAFLTIMVVYILLSGTLPDGVLQSILPLAKNSPFALLVFKSVLFGLFLFILFNFCYQKRYP
ncbi:hypothetical protein EBZ80_10405 [bacterium]|nr:hypothetical protein [bacterium]